MAEKLLTIREVAQRLGTTEREVMELADSGKLPAYKVGGVYLRFKQEQVEEYMRKARITDQRKSVFKDYSLKDRLIDFIYFNDFYIFCAFLIIALLYIIFRE